MREDIYDSIRNEIRKNDEDETSSFNSYEEEMANREMEEKINADLYTKGFRTDCDECEQSFFGTEKYKECPICGNKKLHYALIYIAVFNKQ